MLDCKMEELAPYARVARGATIVFAKSILSTPLALLYLAILARLISPSEMGILTILGLIGSLATTLGDLGLRSSSAKFISELIGRGNYLKALSAYRKILLLSSVTSFLIASLLFFMAPLLTAILIGNSTYEILMLLLSISIPITVLVGVFLSFLQALQRMKELAGFDFAYTNLNRFLGLILLIAFGLSGIFYGSILAGILTIVLSLIVVRKYLKFKKNTTLTFPSSQLLSFSIPMLGVGLLSLALDWADRSMIWAYLSLSDLGIYQVATIAFSFLLLLPSAISTALYPQLSELYGRYGASALSDAFKKLPDT